MLGSVRTLSLALAILSSIMAPAASRPLSLIGDIAPVNALLRDLTRGAQSPDQLIATVQPIHDFALKPSDIRKLQGADLIVWLGPQSTPALAGIMSQPEFSGRALELNALPGVLLLGRRAPGVFDPPAGANTVFAPEPHDPHTWLYPPSALVWAEAITRRLIAVDPENSMTYASNNQSLQAAIRTAEAEGRSRLAVPGARPFVQLHDAFQYFERHFGLAPIGALTADDEDAPSLGVLYRLRADLANRPETCLFLGKGQQAGRARPLLEITGVIPAEIDPVGRDLPGTAGYPALIATIVDGFAGCLY